MSQIEYPGMLDGMVAVQSLAGVGAKLVAGHGLEGVDVPKAVKDGWVGTGYLLSLTVGETDDDGVESLSVPVIETETDALAYLQSVNDGVSAKALGFPKGAAKLLLPFVMGWLQKVLEQQLG